jgi:hypothetical protein
MEISKEEMERRLAFHEKRMNDLSLKSDYADYWREKSVVLYWHYLDLLTK